MNGAAPQELILYATPTGPLGRALDRFFADHGTTAQTYPPHVTLTGFFRRPETRADEIARQTADFLATSGQPEPAEVDIVELRTTDEWCGLVVDSPWLIDLTDRWMATQRVDTGEDALRPKRWLHLSLAYGDGAVADVAEAATAAIDVELTVGWEVGLWRRVEPGAWMRLV